MILTDLHTHILPGIDDGAPDLSVSLAMLEMEYAQGIRRVALTPHFYFHEEEPRRFLKRRQRAMEQLERHISKLHRDRRALLPELVLAAEVAWHSGMDHWQELEQLCYANTRYILIELPFQEWSGSMIDQLYIFMERTGLIPVIAHIDRYYYSQSKDLILALFDMGIPIQLSASELLYARTRGTALQWIKKRDNIVLISDCHHIDRRKPNMGPALEVIRHKLGFEYSHRVKKNTQVLPRWLFED